MPLFNVGPLEYKNTLLDTYNDTRKAPYEIEKLRNENFQQALKNAFLPASTWADVMSKSAYAAGRPFEIIGNIASNPDILSLVDPNKLSSLINTLQNFYSPGTVYGGAAPNGMNVSSQIPSSTEPNFPSAVNEFQGGDSSNANALATKINEARKSAGSNIFSGKGTGRGAGTVYTDPNTGQSFVSPTTPTASTLQNQLIAGENIDLRSLGKVYSSIQQGIPGVIGRATEKIGTAITGGKSPTPNITNQALLNSLITNNADRMIKENNLNSAGVTLHSMINSIRPYKNESIKGYSDRMNLLQDLLEEKNESARKAFLIGLNLNPQAARSEKSLKELSKKYETFNAGRKVKRNDNELTYNPTTGGFE